jgi:hypothetical protein
LFDTAEGGSGVSNPVKVAVEVGNGKYAIRRALNLVELVRASLDGDAIAIPDEALQFNESLRENRSKPVQFARAHMLPSTVLKRD